MEDRLLELNRRIFAVKDSNRKWELMSRYSKLLQEYLKIERELQKDDVMEYFGESNVP